MTPLEEAFIRATTLLDDPMRDRKQIVDHLDTMINYARDDDEKRACYDFKAMALNHIDSIGRDAPAVTEEKRVRALMAAGHLTRCIRACDED